MKHRVAVVFRVAFSLVTTATLLVTAVFAQTTKRGTSKSRVNKSGSEAVNRSRNETLKLCQGVPIPAGYVIIAYMTSSTCPHGLYILKKQDPYSESLAISKRGASEPGQTSAPLAKPAGTSAPRPQHTGRSASVMRPRRVGAQPARDVTAPLSVAQNESPAGPPQLTGVTPLGSPVNATSDAESTP